MSAQTIYKINDHIDAARERVGNLTEEARTFLVVSIPAAAMLACILIDGLVL